MATKLPKANITKLVIRELAAVTEGAQSEAGSVVLKSKVDAVPGKVLETAAAELVVPPTAIEKKSLLTSPEAGHTHLLMGVDDAMAGTTTSERIYVGSSDSYSSYHSHPWVKDESGNIVIGEAAGHSHTALGATTSVAKAADKETDMKTKPEDFEAELAKLRAYGELNDEQKAFYAGLSDVSKSAFLTKSAEERTVEVTKAREADPVVVTVDGVEIRKSAGPTMIALAKKAKEAEAQREELELAKLEKRATTVLGNLPKTLTLKARLLKAVDREFTDTAEHAEVIEMLTAGNNHAVEVTKNIGHGAKPGATSARAAWDAGLTAFAKAKNVDPVHATEAFLDTPEGEQLAEAMEAERDGN